MKQNRQQAIIDLIEKYDIDTQEEIVSHLKKNGYHVTQATVSRDIRELKLSKIPNGQGKQKYVFLQNSREYLGEKYIRIFSEGLVSMETAQNILVIKTVSGMAMAVAAALDAMHFQEIVGSIAGDDTIMAALRSAEDANAVKAKINEMIQASF
ncbi:MAG: arginine repressor [Lachnospiraceae bacterium]|nr:arginine repressor [Lachnospiraceae bacterium]